jgi:pyruvate formate lyase activating enzyme
MRGFLETSFVDWPGKLCSIFFMGGCNFRCPFCHNHPLVVAPQTLKAFPVPELLTRLRPYKGWLGGICISGGEPTLSPELPSMIAHLKAEGWGVKLDTNGSRPHILARLLEEGLLDMVAMDVKAPLVQEKYDLCAGVAVELDAIRESITLLEKSAVRHEFRMTILPRFHSPQDIEAWVSSFQPAASLKLQNFRASTTLDPTFSEEAGFAPDVFENLKKMCANRSLFN